MVGLLMIAFLIDYALGTITNGASLALMPLLAFHRSPDAWNPETVFKTPEEAVEAISKQGFTSRTAEQETEYLKNSSSKAVADAIKANDRTFYDGLDAKIKEATGVGREPTMKTGDYILAQLNGSIKGKKELQGLYDELKEKGMSDSQAVIESKKQFDAFKIAAKQREETLTGEIDGYKRGAFTNKLNSQINEAMSKISPTLLQGKSDTEKILFQNTIENIINNFKLSFKAVDHNGGIIFHNSKDDTPVISTTDGNHLSTFTILSSMFEKLVDKERTQSGTGGAGANQRGPGTGGEVNLPDNVKTKMDLYNYLEKDYKVDGKNIAPGSRAFNNLYDKLKADLPIG